MERYHTKIYENKELLVEQYLVRGGSYQLCWHKAVELLLVLKGEVEAYVNGELRLLQKDDLTLINSNNVHSLFVKDPDSIFLVIEIHPGYLKKLPEFRSLNLRIDFSTDERSRTNPFVSMIRYYCAETFSHSMREGQLEQRMAEQYLGVLLYELLAKFGVAEEKQGRSNDRQHEALQVAMDFMEENYDSPISLEQVAEKTKYNRTYLSTLFKSGLGMSFRDYLVRVRLRHAIEQLAETDKSVLQIALDCGFSNVTALTTSVKKYCGKNRRNTATPLRARIADSFPPSMRTTNICRIPTGRRNGFCCVIRKTAFPRISVTATPTGRNCWRSASMRKSCWPWQRRRQKFSGIQQNFPNFFKFR